MQNVLYVLLDGMEDDPDPKLGGKKPYEVAEMPFIRKKAPYLGWTTGRGYTQLFLNEFWTGHPPDIARAAIEACGLGMDVKNRTAFRMSPAFIRNGTVHWAYGIDDQCDRLENCIKEHLDILQGCAPQVEFFVHGRSVITMNYDCCVPTGPQAPTDGPLVPIPGPLGELIDKVSDDMNGLTVYPWGVGTIGKIYPPFPEVREMTAISDSPTALGIAATLGHKIRLVPDLEDRFPIAKEALKNGNVFLHMDEVDEYSHEKDARKKISVLERIDRLMEYYFPDAENIVFFVDHGTSCITGSHILMNVPFRTTKPVFNNGEFVELDRLVPTIMEKMK